MRAFAQILAAAASAALIGCGGDVTPPPTPKSVAFATHAASMVADDALDLAATLTMSNGSAGPQSLIAYSTSAPEVATVDSKGLVTAIAAGTSTISAQVGSLHDEMAVTVSWAPIVSITFGRDTATLLLDDSLSTSAVVINSHNKPAPNAVVTYSSPSTDVATVDANGRIRTFATGVAIVTATVENLHTTISVKVVPHFTQIANGGMHTCGITGTQRLYCWGSDDNGNLGVGAGANCSAQIGGPCSLVPIPVTGAERFVSVTVGDFHTCALTSGGVAYCWGGNQYGQVGVGAVGGRQRVPTAVNGGHTFSSISAGRMHTCGIDTTGDTWCWGWDFWGQLGAGVTGTDRCSFFYTNEPCSGTPLKVAGAHRFAAVVGAESNSCGRDVSGAVYCWGGDVGGTDSTDCQPALPNAICTRTPLLQVGGATFSRLGMGSYRCGQNSDGVLWCWGFDFDGTFGNGSTGTNSPNTLIRAAGGKSYSQVAFGTRHICGMNSGSVECWGYNEHGEAGGALGAQRTTPGALGGGISFASITSGPVAFTSCGISTAGRAYCWGFGIFGQLGDGTLTSNADPVLVKLVR